MWNNIHAQLPTAIIVTLIATGFVWGLEKIFGVWYRSIKKPNRLKRYAIQGLRWVTLSLVILGTILISLVLILRLPRYVLLAQHAQPLAIALVGAPYQAKHKGLPCEPKFTQPYLEKVGKLSKFVRDQEYMAALRWDFSEGLLEEVDIHPTDDGGAKRDFRITLLGEKFIEELCRTGKL